MPNLKPSARIAHLARIGVFPVLAALAVSTTGCRKIRQKMEQKAAEEAVKAGTGGAVTVNDGDQGGMTFKDNKGNVVTLGETKIPADWPTSIPVYKGKVMSSVSTKEQGKTAHVVMVETTDSPDTVFAFYKSKLSGFEQQSEMNSNQVRMLVMEDKKAKTHVTVIIGISNGNTTVQVAATQG